jgi:HD-GYP domain-containing protein (c-di-GMP phosphodiesterase class II)
LSSRSVRKQDVSILNEPGKLTDDEFTIVKSHPMQGYETLLASGVDNERVLDVCRHHHEKDGRFRLP